MPQAATDADLTAARPLDPAELDALNAYWRAANYLSVGQIYLLENPLLRRPLEAEDIKPRLLGHWGTTPGLNFVYAHMNRVIRSFDLDAMYVIGPGHGGPAAVANAWLEGTLSEVYPAIARDEQGMQRLFRQFSFPGGVPSHVAPETPGSIHEGGELGYSLTHAFGAAFDNPDLVVACIVGDGEAETGPLAASWHSNKFLNPATDGAVLPILHLNGYKIANPTILARIPDAELDDLLAGYGYRPYWVSGDDPATMHQLMAATLDRVIAEIREIQGAARAAGAEQATEPTWPMIVLRSPKGWTGPKVVDGLPVEGTWRAHQVPIAEARTNDAHRRQLEEWMRSYRPEELFDAGGAPIATLRDLPPTGERRMSANPHANGGLLLRDLTLPDFRTYAVPVDQPGTATAEATRVLGQFLRDVIRANPNNFRLMGPDETESNRLGAVFEATNRVWEAAELPTDEHLARTGRVMEVLSEHLCEGWLEGYLLTGRHGLFNCYEAFIHIVDSMFNQHAKWLKTTRDIPWRRPIASLNYLLSSHVWRQDHNGFSHQDPGFIDHVVNKKADVIRVFLPPDANCLLEVADHCLRSRDYVNVIVAGKQPALQWLSMDDAILHCTRGIGIWEWASNSGEAEPDVVMACCGDVPTVETLAAVDILRRELPDLRIRVVNVVDLMRLQDPKEHPHGLADAEFDALFTTSRPVIFAYHGYPWLIHRLTYRRTNHPNLHVRGYKEEGTTTTPFDMVMLNDLDRFHLVMDVIDRVPGLTSRAGELRQDVADRRLRARQYTRDHGEDQPEIPELDLADGWDGDNRRDQTGLMRILIANAGSSSLKLRVLDDGDVPTGSADLGPADGPDATDEIERAVRGFGAIDAVGHRIVHGGAEFTGPVLVDADVRSRLVALSDLAPLHQPKSIAALDAVTSVLPDVPAVACFDTAFHATIPAAAATYALPREWRERWPIRRYGFHGLSHAYAARRAEELWRAGVRASDVPRPFRVVTCHLGAGASLAAIVDGRSVDTTMGFTPLEGLVMATRSGSVDPGLVLWLQSHAGLSAEELLTGLDRKSGLLGLAGSADMRDVVAGVGRGDPSAGLAFEVYIHRLVGLVAAMAASAGGLDALVFTGGVGEHAPEVRWRAVAGLAFLGVALDAAANRAADANEPPDVEISAVDAAVHTFVIEAREDLQIAAEVRRLLW